MRNVGLAIMVALSLVKPCFASHPQLLLDPTELDFIRAKVANNTADWRELKDICDGLTTAAVQWPDAISGGSSLGRGYVAGSSRSRERIETGYNGSGFDKAITELGVCYQAVKATNPAVAAQYLAKAHQIITVIAQPPITLTRQKDGVIRYALSVDSQGKDLKAGASLAVFLPYSIIPQDGETAASLAVGEIWTLSGATGCSSMNGTWLASNKDRNIVSFTSVDGSPAPTLNANCTTFAFDPMRDTGFAFRVWIPALAKAYDWFYDELSAKERDNLVFCMNAWMHELALTGLHSRHPEDNYAFDDFWALVAAYIATDGDNQAWSSFYTSRITDRLTGSHQVRDYQQQWFSGGGFGEGWQAYGFNATRAMMNAVLAMKIHGVDWSHHPVNFNFVDDTLRYWMEFTTPPKLALDDNEYVYPIGAVDKGVTEPVFIPLGHAAMFTAVARRFHSPLARQFQSWFQEVSKKIHAAEGKNIPAWNGNVYPSRPEPVDEFLYYDPMADSSDWKTLPMMYRAWSGDYAVTRSDWTDDAVEVTLLGGPSVGSAGNGKTQFNSGSLTVQRGNRHLLVYGLGEAARSGDLIGVDELNKLHQERGSYGNKKNSIFWAGASLEEKRNQGLTSRTPPPGQISSVASWPSSIDLAEDTSEYTYWRAKGLEANNARSSVDRQYHQAAWTREVLFLRPELVIVHDRTSVLNNGDDRAMFWTFGRSLTHVANMSSGMTRYDATSSGLYRGAFTSVLPTSPSVSVVDHDDLHFLYRVEVRPSTMDHKEDEWLAVLDAANSPDKVTPLSTVSCKNAVAVKLENAKQSVIAFAQSNPVSLPITLAVGKSAETYVTGLNPNTNYTVTMSGPVLTIASDGGTQLEKSSPAGVLVIHRPQ